MNKKKRDGEELKLKQTDISDNNLMRFDLRPPRQRLCSYNRIISAEVSREKRKSHNPVSKGRPGVCCVFVDHKIV